MLDRSRSRDRSRSSFNPATSLTKEIIARSGAFIISRSGAQIVGR